MNAYDVVKYPNLCHPQAQPDRLGVSGRLFGLETALPSECRVLELGCGDGANLLALATMHPRSRFVGVDLSETAIAEGQEAIRALGLSNFELIHGDLATFSPDTGAFDYVVSHGVYSWVPPRIRDRVLEIASHALVANGVAFVSYNCFPGGHIRRMIREIMRFHVRELEDPAEQVGQAVAITRFIAASIEKPDPYRQVFKEQLEQVQQHGPGHLFHDDLASVNDPVYFHEFASHAAAFGLQFLAEADVVEMQDDLFTPEVRGHLGSMADDRITREQYLDFLKCRRFRQTLLCHSRKVLHPQPDANVIRGLHVASCAAASPTGRRTERGQIVRFATPRGAALELDDPLCAEALRLLAEAWPWSPSFTELFSKAYAAVDGNRDQELVSEARLVECLLESYLAGVVELHMESNRCDREPPERPRLPRHARWQLEQDRTLTTLRGENLRVDDLAGRRFLSWLDGTRAIHDLEELVKADADLRPNEGDPASPNVEKRLKELLRLGLIES